MIASLPMYDRPETAGANDRLWALIRRFLYLEKFMGPDALSRNADGIEHWLDKGLIFSQTCGLPYRLHLYGKVHLVGTPTTTIGDHDGHYHSVIVVHENAPFQSFTELKGSLLACNMGLSQSGWAAPQNMALEQGFSFENVALTGSHRASAKAVSEGRADVAALDAISWKMMQRYDPWACDLRVITRTPPTPMLPYITAYEGLAVHLSYIVEAAIAALSNEDRETLCLRGLTQLPAEEYLAVPTPAFPKVSAS